MKAIRSVKLLHELAISRNMSSRDKTQFEFVGAANLPIGPGTLLRRSMEIYLEIIGGINSKSADLTAIMRQFETPAGPKFESKELIISWLIFHKFGFKSSADVTECIKNLEKCRDQAKKLLLYLGRVDSIFLQEMEEQSYLVTLAPNDEENGNGSIAARPEHQSYEDILGEMISDIDKGIALLNKLKTEEWGDSPTRNRNPLAYKIAFDVACVYKQLTDKEPGYGAGNRGKQATPYLRAVADIYAMMDLKAGPRGPCKAAIAELKRLSTSTP
ncbi:MAG: hypothetical protein V7695_19570 [Sulfitobacter sp.]